MRPLTVSLIQTATHWHDPAANRTLFDRWFAEVPAEADLVVLPEMFATGFTMAAAEVAEPMDGATVTWLRAAADRLGRTVCGSLVIAAGGRHFNRFLWASPGPSRSPTTNVIASAWRASTSTTRRVTAAAWSR
jgi:omega-amidase